jgi:ubiquinol-cytochrome c reductase cytochrome b subunit
MPMIERVWKWFTVRWPFYPLKHLLLDENIAGGASYAYTMGSAILAVIGLQVATGIIQFFYYVPTIDHAYDSVSYLRTEVPFGWLVHNMHYWGANIMVVLVALHMMRVYIWGAYKSQLTWLIGVGLLVTTMALTFTGAPMIWDMKGYWAGEVGSSITGTAPVFGGIMKTILRGGETMGQLTLTRFFAIHIVILVPALFFLIAMHVASFRTTGIVGTWNKEKRKQIGLFWPDQVFKDTVVLSIVIFILLTLSVYYPAPFTGPADPANTTYLPKPEWNFLFLYQALKYFKGPFETIGTAGVPTALIGLLVLLPFIDRKPERNPALRPLAMLSLAVYAGTILTLTIIGYLSPGYAEMPASTAKTVSQQQSSAKEAQPQPGTASRSASALNADGTPGAKLFKSVGCIACHSINGAGGSVGPDLSGERSKGRDSAWLVRQIRDPRSGNPNSIMPAFTTLTDRQVNDLADYLLGRTPPSVNPDKTAAPVEKPAQETANVTEKASPAARTAAKKPAEAATSAAEKLPGHAAYTIGDAENGAVLFKERCASCHGQEGKGGVPNPGSHDEVVPALNPVDSLLFSTDPRFFARNIDIYIQQGSVPGGPDPALKMLPFGDSNALTQEEIANVEAYILSLNKVDRAALIDPGMQPLSFFYLASAIFAAVALILGGIWNKKYRCRCE